MRMFFNNLFFKAFCLSVVIIYSASSSEMDIFNHDVNFLKTIEHTHIEKFPQILSSSFKEEAKKLKHYDDFKDEESQENSTRTWVLRCKLLKLASCFGDEEAKNIYKEDIESKKYSRDCADCFIAGYEDEYDIKTVRAFFWEHLAYEDEKEKEELVKAYIEGKLVPLNTKRSEFWKKYSVENPVFHISY